MNNSLRGSLNSSPIFQMTDEVNRYEWYTPSQYIYKAHQVLGKIDFDPCSSNTANEVVGATQYYTADDDATVIPWPSVDTVWMNPPYSRTLLQTLAQIFINNYVSGNFRAGIVLINNTSETKYWQLLAKSSTVICNVNHRISFALPDGSISPGNTRGQTFFYF